MSRNSRTLLGLAAAFLLLLLAVAAVAGRDTGASGDTGAGATGEKVSGNVSVMGIWTGEEQKKFQAVIDAFNEQQPDVTVKHNLVGDNLLTAPRQPSRAVTCPTSPTSPSRGSSRASSTRARPLPIMELTVQENFGDSIVEVGTFNDQFYGLMFKAANKSLYWYNVQAFSDAGVEATDDWNTFLENAETLEGVRHPGVLDRRRERWTLTDLFENIYIQTAGGTSTTSSRSTIPKRTDQSAGDAPASRWRR